MDYDVLKPVRDYIEELEHDRRILLWLSKAGRDKVMECFDKLDFMDMDATLVDAVLETIEKEGGVTRPC